MFNPTKLAALVFFLSVTLLPFSSTFAQDDNLVKLQQQLEQELKPTIETLATLEYKIGYNLETAIAELEYKLDADKKIEVLRILRTALRSVNSIYGDSLSPFVNPDSNTLLFLSTAISRGYGCVLLFSAASGELSDPIFHIMDRGAQSALGVAFLVAGSVSESIKLSGEYYREGIDLSEAEARKRSDWDRVYSYTKNKAADITDSVIKLTGVLDQANSKQKSDYRASISKAVEKELLRNLQLVNIRDRREIGITGFNILRALSESKLFSPNQIKALERTNSSLKKIRDQVNDSKYKVSRYKRELTPASILYVIDADVVYFETIKKAFESLFEIS